MLGIQKTEPNRIMMILGKIFGTHSRGRFRRVIIARSMRGREVVL